jgi:hypothetical protein
MHRAALIISGTLSSRSSSRNGSSIELVYMPAEELAAAWTTQTTTGDVGPRRRILSRRSNVAHHDAA